MLSDDSKSKIVSSVKHVISLLVEKRFDELDGLCPKSRGRARDVMYWIFEDERTLVMPPDEIFTDYKITFLDDREECVGQPRIVGGRADLEIMELPANRGSKRWAIAVLMWTAEDGCSDYTFELAIEETSEGALEISLEDLHVW